MSRRLAPILVAAGLLAAGCSSDDDDSDPTSASAPATSSDTTTPPTTVAVTATTEAAAAGGGLVLTLEDGPGTPRLVDATTGRRTKLDVGSDVLSQVTRSVPGGVLVAGQDDDNVWLLGDDGELVDLAIAAGESLEPPSAVERIATTGERYVVLNPNGKSFLVDTQSGTGVDLVEQLGLRAEYIFATLSTDEEWIAVNTDAGWQLARTDDLDSSIEAPGGVNVGLGGINGGRVIYRQRDGVYVGSLDDEQPFRQGTLIDGDVAAATLVGDTILTTDSDGVLYTTPDGTDPTPLDAELPSESLIVGLRDGRHALVLGPESAVIDVTSGVTQAVRGFDVATSDEWMLFDAQGNDTRGPAQMTAVHLETGEVVPVDVPETEFSWEVESMQGDRFLLYTGCGEPGAVVDITSGEQSEIDQLCTGELSPDGTTLAWSSGADDADPNELLIAPVDDLANPTVVDGGGFPIAFLSPAS